MQHEKIVEENIRAANSKVVNVRVANEMVNILKRQILNEPTKSILMYSNLRLSGRHIVWAPTKH